jgi:hypothetical protein
LDKKGKVMTTPRELLDPFLQKLRNREQELSKKMENVNTTPEDHGEATAARMTEFELRYRLRLQESGKMNKGWEQEFLDNYLRKKRLIERGFQPRNRKEAATAYYESLYADELEKIWRDALAHFMEGRMWSEETIQKVSHAYAKIDPWYNPSRRPFWVPLALAMGCLTIDVD